MWNYILTGLNTLASIVMAVCAVIALRDWKKEKSIIAYKDIRNALNNLNEILIKLDDVHNRLMPSFVEIEALLKEIEPLKAYLYPKQELYMALENYCQINKIMVSYLTILYKKNGSEVSDNEKAEKSYKKVQELVLYYFFKIPQAKEEVKKALQKALS